MALLGPSTSPSKPLPGSLRRAVKLLLAARRGMPLDELATSVGVSKYHLSRLFVRYVGRPPHRYFNEIQIARAEHLLREGACGVDVAYELGFADQAHLCRRFKRTFGLTPKEYVRSCRK